MYPITSLFRPLQALYTWWRPRVQISDNRQRFKILTTLENTIPPGKTYCNVANSVWKVTQPRDITLGLYRHIWLNNQGYVSTVML